MLGRKRKHVRNRVLLEGSYGFTLIEMLVVVGVIALLMAVLMPVLHKAREQGQRIVCLSHLNQLTLAWNLYAQANDERLVNGRSGIDRPTASGVEKAWLGRIRSSADPNERDQEKAIGDGALWPYVGAVQAYRCPRGRSGDLVTSSIVGAANGLPMVGTQRFDTGIRVGQTVLWLKKRTEIIHPGPAQRAVFVDEGWTGSAGGYNVVYLGRYWLSPPPIHHIWGMNISMADGHAEYWNWKSEKTVKLGRERFAGASLGGVPRTDEAMEDLQRVQKATWGRLGY